MERCTIEQRKKPVEEMDLTHHREETYNRNGSKPETADKEDSFIVDNVDVRNLTDDELSERLKKFNVSFGPIVASTRKLYQRTLAMLMAQASKHISTVQSKIDYTEQVKDNSIHPTGGSLRLRNRDGKGTGSNRTEFDNSLSVEPNLDDVKQPSLIVRPSKATTNLKGGPENEAQNKHIGSNPSELIFRPSPRRSIYDYKGAYESEPSRDNLLALPVSGQFSRANGSFKVENGTKYSHQKVTPSSQKDYKSSTSGTKQHIVIRTLKLFGYLLMLTGRLLLASASCLHKLIGFLPKKIRIFLVLLSLLALMAFGFYSSYENNAGVGLSSSNMGKHDTKSLTGEMPHDVGDVERFMEYGWEKSEHIGNKEATLLFQDSYIDTQSKTTDASLLKNINKETDQTVQTFHTNNPQQKSNHIQETKEQKNGRLEDSNVAGNDITDEAENSKIIEGENKTVEEIVQISLDPTGIY